MPDGYKPIPKQRDNERFVREQDTRRRRERSRSPVDRYQPRGPRENSRERPHDREYRENRDSRQHPQPFRNGGQSPTTRQEALPSRLPPPPPPPVQTQPTSAKKPVFRSRLQEELAKFAKDKLTAHNSNSKLNDLDSEMTEAGAERKRKHEEVVWQPASKRLAVGTEPQGRSTPTPPKNLMDRALLEVEEFERKKEDLGYDSDAPAAIKSSPSFSDDTGAHANNTRDARQATAEDEDEGDVEGLPGRSSRWQMDDDEEDTRGVSISGARGISAAPKGDEEEEEGELMEEVPGSREESQAAGSQGAVAAAAGPADGAAGDTVQAEEPTAAEMGISMLAGCRNVSCFERIGRISEGTYGVVYKAREHGSNKLVALKKIKMENERDGFPPTSIREINILLSLKHPNIVNVNEVVVGDDINSIFMVMEYLDHDLKDILDKQKRNNPFSPAEAKQLMRQLLLGVAYMHENWVIHRDLKTSNILYSGRGELKICDFGLARQYGSPLQAYTHRVVTLWYRAPELLLGQTLYSTAIDMWSVGCIMGELLLAEPLFPGKDEFNQMDKIFQGIGSPTEQNWPNYRVLPNASKINQTFYKGNLRDRVMKNIVGTGRITITEKGWDLMSQLLQLDPTRRISAKEALEHPWFREHPPAKDMALMPTFAARGTR